MTKPKPLDLKWLDKVLETNKKNSELEIWCKKFNKKLKQEIIKRLKSACEFWLRYKDKPELLIKEYKKLPNNFSKLIKYDADLNTFVYEKEDYNLWLFKFAFKDVLGDEK